MRASCLAFCSRRRRKGESEKGNGWFRAFAGKRPATASGCGGAGPSAVLPLLPDAQKHRLRRGALQPAPRRSQRRSTPFFSSLLVRRVGGVAPMVVLVLFGWLGAGTADGQEDSTAPPAAAFVERSMHILHLPLLEFGAAEPSAPAPGAFEWILSSAYATTYSTTWHARRFHADPVRRGTPLSQEEADSIHAIYPQDQVLFVDGEALRTSLTARYGIAPSLSVSVEVPYIARGLTGLESFVSKFHKAFGVDENGRDEFPSGRFT